jgi:hypothetical protein
MRVLLSTLVLAAALHAQRLSEPDAFALIEKARAEALRYTSALPDFICTQMIHRYHDPRGNNRWERLDVLTVKLSFFGRFEDYKLLEIDGKPALLDYLNTGGPTSKGEFGTALLQLFHPKTEAQFRLKGFTTVNKRRAAVYRYRVDQAHTQFHVSYGPVHEGPNHILAPYYGEVTVEPGTGHILRLTQHAELPARFPIHESSSFVEYDFATVGGTRYLLPMHAETTMAAGRYKSRNVVDFKDYRKFQTEATISFDK